MDETIPWITFAPLEPHWVVPSRIPLPFEFSEGVSLSNLPAWIHEDDPSDSLRDQLREKLDSDVQRCVQIKYGAKALSYEQQDATGKIFSLHLALWLCKGTPLHFNVIAHAENFRRQWITRHIVSYNAAIALPVYEGESLTLDDLQKAKILFEVMLKLKKEGTVRIALTSAITALTEGTWQLRYLLFWLALEALFGPSDAREITFRLSQRTALFLESEGAKAEELFKMIRKSYGWRSKIVHGLRVTNLEQQESLKLVEDLEIIVRRSIAAILAKETVAAIFEGDEREEYLDKLAFN